jgi:ABC-type sugar transport system permease subunit
VRLRRSWRRNLIAYLFILPAFSFVLLFMAYPLLDGLFLSLYQWDGLSPRRFVGLANFQALFKAPDFAGGIRNTVLFTVCTTVAKIVIGGLLAIALHLEVPGWKIFRALFYLNVILPVTAVGVLWSAILNPNTGLLAAILGLFGGEMPSMLGNPRLVMWVLIVIDIWQYSGFPMIFLYAAMEGIPRELYEAAELEGISVSKRIIYITLPLIKSVLVTITMLQTIFSFKVFEIVFTMTKGGPGSASEVLTLYLYKEGFWFLRFGSASAAAVVLLVIVLVVSYVYLRQGRLGKQEFEY